MAALWRLGSVATISRDLMLVGCVMLLSCAVIGLTAFQGTGINSIFAWAIGPTVIHLPVEVPIAERCVARPGAHFDRHEPI